MTETEFHNRVHETWAEVESMVDDWSERADLDVEITRAGSVLEIEFDSGAKIVINPQAPMQQIWLASPWGAFHFVWNVDRWQDTRSEHDFWQVLQQEASKASDGQI